MANTRVRHFQLVPCTSKPQRGCASPQMAACRARYCRPVSLIRSLTRLNGEQRNSRLASIRTMRFRGEGILTSCPDILSHMGLTSLSLHASLSSLMINRLFEHLSMWCLRSLEIDNLTPSLTSKLDDYIELLVCSAPTLEKLSLRCLRDDDFIFERGTLPIFRCLRFVSARLLSVTDCHSSLLSQVLVNAPVLDVLVLEGQTLTSKVLLESCKESVKALCLDASMHSTGDVLLHMPLPNLKTMKIVGIQAAALSGSSRLLQSLPAHLEHLELQSMWHGELLQILEKLLPKGLSSLALEDCSYKEQRFQLIMRRSGRQSSINVVDEPSKSPLSRKLGPSSSLED